MKRGNKMQNEKERFIRKIVNEAQRNLEQNLDEAGKHSVIIPYRKKVFLKILKYMEEINKEAEKRPMPFKAFELKEFPGEIKFKYMWFLYS